MGPQSPKEQGIVAGFGPPHRIAALGRDNRNLNEVARGNQARTQALVEARHRKIRFLQTRNQLHGQALFPNLGNNELV
jgi:hypothetical protein